MTQCGAEPVHIPNMGLVFALGVPTLSCGGLKVVVGAHNPSQFYVACEVPPMQRYNWKCQYQHNIELTIYEIPHKPGNSNITHNDTTSKGNIPFLGSQ